MNTAIINLFCFPTLQHKVWLELVVRLSHSVTVQRHCGVTIKDRAPGTMPAEKEREKRRLMIQVQLRRFLRHLPKS